MNIETITAEAVPMVYVTRSVGMNATEITAVMDEAFGAIGESICKTGIAPAGPPLAVYRDWDESSGRMKVDVGFPVAPGDTARIEGEVAAGKTPCGKALKAVHVGPYDTLRDTYNVLMAHMREHGMQMPLVSWEVFPNDPQTTPPEKLITEIYMQVA
jgi:effector-binding domain-containing protein